MKVENLFLTSTKTFLATSPHLKEMDHASSNFFSDISELYNSLVNANSNIRSKRLASIGQYESIFLNSYSIERFVNVLDEVSKGIHNELINDLIKESMNMKGKVFCSKDVAHTDESPITFSQFLGLNFLIHTIRVYKTATIDTFTRYLLPTINVIIEWKDAPSTLKILPVEITPSVVIWHNKESRTKSDEVVVSLSLISVITKKLDMELSVIPPFLDTYENNVYRKSQILFKIEDDNNWLGLQKDKDISSEVLNQTLINYCSNELRLFSVGPSYKETKIHSAIASRIIDNDGKVFNVPDIRNFNTIHDEHEPFFAFLTLLHDSLKVARDSSIYINELPYALKALKAHVFNRDGNSLILFSKRVNRIFAASSFTDDFPNRSYLRFVISNVLRSENISTQLLLLRSLNKLTEENAPPMKFLRRVKEQIGRLDLIFNLETDEDFMNTDIAAIQKLIGIDSVLNSISWKLRLTSSLIFEESQKGTIVIQIILGVMTAILTLILVLNVFHF